MDQQQRDSLAQIGLQSAEILHDLSNLVATACAEAGLLELESRAGSLNLDTVRDLISTCRRMQEMTADALAPLRGDGELIGASFAPADVAKEVVRDATLRFPSLSVGVSLQIDPAVRISGQESLFTRVLHNLLQNASRYSDGEIRVSLSPHPQDGERGFLLSVEDNGPGVPDEVLSQLFQPLAHASELGYGLGLSSARRCAEMLGGRLEYLRSDLLGGARFDLWLRTSSPLALSEEGQDSTFGPTPRVVIVGDSEDIRRLAVPMLSRRGFWVSCVDPGDEPANEIAATVVSGEYDLVILDVRMPAYTGWDVARWIIERAPHLSGSLLSFGGSPGFDPVPNDLRETPRVPKGAGWGEVADRLHSLLAAGAL